MGLEQVWDAVARQAAEVAGIKAAYATRTGGQGATVQPYPNDVVDGPVAIVDYAGSEIVNLPPFERFAHEFELALWMPLGNGSRAAAVAALAPLFELVVSAFRANEQLYGTATTSQVMGSTGFVDESPPGVLDKTHLVQRIVIRTTVARSVTPGIGPSS